MKIPAFCILENKGADKLHGNHRVDQCLSFRYLGSTIPLRPNAKFQTYSHLLLPYSPLPYSPACVGPGLKTYKLDFS